MPAHEANQLPLPVKIGYAAAETGVNAVETLLRLYLLIFYTDAVGLSPGLAGLAVALGLIWDAVTDPLMGYLSDRTLRRFGGRRIYLLIGAVAVASALYLVFSPPPLESEWSRFGYLLTSYILLNTAMTILSVPYMAMAGEMTTNRDERSTLFAFRFAGGNLGAILGAGLPGAFLVSDATATAQGQLSAMHQVGLTLGLIVIMAVVIAWIATRGVRFSVEAECRTPLREDLVRTFRNRPFRPLLIAYVVATFGVAMNSVLALYYYRYRLQFSEGDVQLLLVAFMIILTASLAGWVWFANRVGKLKPLLIGVSLLGVGTSVSYPFFPPGNLWLPLVVGGMVLGACVGSVVLLDSILTDVVDYDRIRSRASRGGMYFGVWRLASKLARAAAVAGTGWMLELIHFVPNAEQTPEVSRALGLLFGPGVGVFLIVAALTLVRYRFTDAKQKQVQRILRRRGMRFATSPT
jgi:GPH family glycoside/pentoside/hexuronide:cation symporter